MPDRGSFRGAIFACLAVPGVWGCTYTVGGQATGPAKVSNEALEDACVAGHYHGSAPEIAAALELGANRRFRYVLIYGAIDERSEGSWSVRDGKLLLTSDPVVPPAFTFLGEAVSPDGQLHVALELPDAISRQYFDAELSFADGTVATHQFAEDGLSVGLSEGRRIESIRILLPLFGLASAAHSIAGTRARSLRFRFDANDIGKIAFAATPLELQENALLLERHGRKLRLLRQEPSCVTP